MCTSSANHRLLGEPTGPEHRDESCSRQCRRWLILYFQTRATLRGYSVRAVVHVVAATSAWCRGTSQRNIAFQMFLRLRTLRRPASRPVAVGVSQSNSLPWTHLFEKSNLTLEVTDPRKESTREIIKVTRDVTEATTLSYSALALIELVPRPGWSKHLVSRPIRSPVLPTLQ